MSATMEEDLFKKYFARPVAGRPEDAPVVKLDGRTYDVGEYYLEDLAELGPVSTLITSYQLLLCLFRLVIAELN